MTRAKQSAIGNTGLVTHARSQDRCINTTHVNTFQSQNSPDSQDTPGQRLSEFVLVS